MAARVSSPATTVGTPAFLMPNSVPTCWLCVHVRPWSVLTATAGSPSEPTPPKYTVPFAPMPTDGSASLAVVPGTPRTVQDVPLSVLTATAAVAPQDRLGR